MNSHVEIAAIDCSKHSDICNRYQIRGYPTLKMFSLAPADDKRYIIDYDGPREVSPLAEFAKRHATSFVYLIKPSRSAKDRSANKRVVNLTEFIDKVNCGYLVCVNGHLGKRFTKSYFPQER